MVQSSSRTEDGQKEAKMRTKRLDKGLQGEMIMAYEKKNAGEDTEEVRTGSHVKAAS